MRKAPGVRGAYQRFCGERRLRAGALAGWTEIPCKVTEASDADVSAMQLMENLLRVDLNAIEMARGLEQMRILTDAGGAGKTYEEIAAMFSKTREWVGSYVRLLKLPAI